MNKYKMDKYTEWEGTISGFKVKTFHGQVTIDEKEFHVLGEEDKINMVILALLKKIDNLPSEKEILHILLNVPYRMIEGNIVMPEISLTKLVAKAIHKRLGGKVTNR